MREPGAAAPPVRAHTKGPSQQGQLQRLQGPGKSKNRDVCTKIVKNVRKATAEDHLVWALLQSMGPYVHRAAPLPQAAQPPPSTTPPARQGLDPKPGTAVSLRKFSNFSRPQFP